MRVALAAALAIGPGWLPAATPPNTPITNAATASYTVAGVATTAAGSVTITTAAHTRSSVEFLQYIPPGAPPSGAVETVAPAQCSASGAGTGPFVPSSGPTPIGGTKLALPGTVRLAPTDYYGGGEPVFVRVTDPDQNLDPLLAETVLVTLTGANGDSEMLRLAETGVSTGVFIGYIQSTRVQVAANDCRLSVGPAFSVSAAYVDATFPSDRSSGTVLVDPAGRIFDSSTGDTIDGARVRLVNKATGQSAVVYCDDGLSPYPDTVVSGASVAACGGTQKQAPGSYRFPRVAPGTYQLLITPPTVYTLPSLAPAAELQALPGAPYVIVAGSRGESFQINVGNPVYIDVPADLTGGELQISKVANQSVIGVGEFLSYALTVRNSGKTQARNAKIVDQLPAGFRFQAGSARLNGAPLPGTSSAPDGRTLTFSIGNIAVGATVTLNYVVEVAAGTPVGVADNIAHAAAPFTSNTAHAAVTVRQDLFQDRAILTGRVYAGPCTEPTGQPEPGLGNVRIVLEDGSYVLTDKEGRWHLDNIRPGTHVVQLDLDSLPDGYEVLACEHNDRFAGRAYSQFVNLRGGTLWRADFHVAKKEAPAAAAGAPADSRPGENVPPTPDQTPAAAAPAGQLVERLPYDAQWLESAKPATEWLHPQQGFQPAVPAIKFAVQHEPGASLTLRVNGVGVSALNYDGVLVNARHTTALSSWSGVALNEGDNLLELTVRNTQGTVLMEERRTVHYAGPPVKAVFDAQRSRLAADGKTRPVIAVRLLDKEGFPARRGIIGNFEVNAPYQAFDTQQAIENEPLAGRLGGKPRFEVLSDGVALIELAPTTKAGEVALSFAFSDRERQEVRAWLAPAARDWVLVGFAEGTVGQKQLSGNLEALAAADADQALFDGDRVAFYAKGQVKGAYLLTIAYDSAKTRGTPDSNTLTQAIDPNQYYTLYADATDPQFDAASARKLYVRIERAQFYALFGDFDTGLTVTELANYSRTVNGLKSEYHGAHLAYNAFATQTSQAYMKDEIQGDGTSGLYALSQRNIVINSDKVRIETRDRFHSEIIVTTRSLTRYLDYDIDPILGTLLFTEPVPVRDADFNPVYIVAEYESGDSTEERLTYGGRVAATPAANLEVGVTGVHEGNVGATGNLHGADLTWKPDGATTVKGEFAGSDRSLAGVDASGDAWKVEAQHDDDTLSARVYAREQAAGFGLGQQAIQESGTRKLGGDARYKWSSTILLDGQIYRQDLLTMDGHRDVAEGHVQLHRSELTAQTGLRYAKDELGGIVTESDQALAGAAYELLDHRLTLRANAEYAFGRAENVDYPDRYLAGVDYKLSAATTAFLEHELDQGEKFETALTRLGLRTTPWSGAELRSTVGQVQNDGTRLFSSLGLTQKWQINEHWQSDVALDRGESLGNTGAVPFNPNVPPAAGLLSGGYTVIAAGAGYNNGAWSGNGRVEHRQSEAGDDLNVLMHFEHQLNLGESIAAGLIYTKTDDLTTVKKSLDARGGLAVRPANSAWMWLDRVDLIMEDFAGAIANSQARRVVNNANVNYQRTPSMQLSLQYGAKYVFTHIDGQGYNGYTDLVGMEIRHDLSAKWDIGASASALHSWNSRTADYSLGASVGYGLMDNIWVAVGYNVHGFADEDFSGAAYRCRGFYLSLRAKFDQDTFHLNNKTAPASKR